MRAAIIMAALVAVAALAAPAAQPQAAVYQLQYAVGNATKDSDWTTKATLLITEHVIKTEDSAIAWTLKDVAALRDGATYRLRITKGSDSNVELAIARFSPCVLLTAKQYANTPIKSTQERIGVVMGANGQPAGLRQLAPFMDTVCELAVFAPALKAAKPAPGALQPEPTAASNIQQKFTVQRAPSLATAADPPMLTSANSGATGKAAKDGKAGEGGESAEPKEDNRTFIEKYWLYIVMFIGYSLVSSFFAPPPAAAGAKGGAAAPAAAAKK